MARYFQAKWIFVKMRMYFLYRLWIIVLIASIVFNLQSCVFNKKSVLLVPLGVKPSVAEICYSDVPFTSTVVIKPIRGSSFYFDFDSLLLSIMDTSCVLYFDLPGINMMTSNEKLKVFLDKWMHTRYRRGGSSQNGTDCSGFVNSLYREVYGKKLSRSSYTMINDVVKIPKNELREGDLVFFKIHKGRISHVGFYLEGGYFVHAARRGGVIISSLEEPYYKRTFYTAGRVKS